MDIEVNEIDNNIMNQPDEYIDANNSSINEELIDFDEEDHTSEEWSEIEGDYNEEISDFNSNSKINISPEILKDPYKLFLLIITEECIKEIAYQTNLYYKQYQEQGGYFSERIKRWENVDSNEIYAFFGILLLLGINKRDSLYDHWSGNELICSLVKTYISQNKFELLWRFFHLHDNNSNITNKGSLLYKINGFLNFMENQWNKIYNPTQQITIDESIIPFRGVTRLKQYCPQKPHKYGIKAWALAEATTGYMLRFSIYEGKSNTNKEEKLSLRVVKSLLEHYKGKNHCVITDSYYSSIDVVNFMNKESFFYIGMVNKNRLKLMYYYN